MAAKGSEQCTELSTIEFFMPSFGPLGSAWMCRAIEGFAELAQVLFGVKAIDDLNGLGEQFCSQIPDPGSPVSERNRTRGLRETTALRLAPDALRKGRTFLSDVGDAKHSRSPPNS